MAQITGLISDIQSFSLHDGPGIRTTVYLKGCQMSCLWCHNPEAIAAAPTLAFYANKCIGCQACAAVCPGEAICFGPDGRRFFPDRCTSCFACVDACPAGALVQIGQTMGVDEVFQVIAADADYYRASGGGVTLSGGEPLLQPAFVQSLLERCREAGIDTAIESNLSVSYSILEPILPLLDRIFCDIKLLDDSRHRAATGVSNRLLLANLERLAGEAVPLVIRTPLIPGWTADDDNIRAIARWIAQHCPRADYELLNYNPFAKAKYEPIGQTYTLPDAQALPPETVRRFVAIARTEHSSSRGATA
jgi:pyruvate formate lyase activating enzyme